jgi:hypothetical protein
MKTSTAKQHGWRCPVCGDETSQDPDGKGYVRHKTNRACQFEKGMRDRESSRPATPTERPAECAKVSSEKVSSDLVQKRPGGKLTRFLSYGEDPLTFWALKFNLVEILKQLGDQASPEQALVIYRPSFGRQGKAKEMGPGSVARAEFGEFDAIIGTPGAVYLVESKWGSSAEAKGVLLSLRPEQAHRHKVFRWYLEVWRAKLYARWQDFVIQNSARFQKQFPGNKLAPDGSTLAKNLQFVLSELSFFGNSIRNVLMFIGLPDEDCPTGVENSGFSMVSLQYKPIHPTVYFEMFL